MTLPSGGQTSVVFSYPASAVTVAILLEALRTWPGGEKLRARLRCSAVTRRISGRPNVEKALAGCAAVEVLDVESWPSGRFDFHRGATADQLWECPYDSRGSDGWWQARIQPGVSVILAHAESDLLAQPILDLWIDLPGARLAATWRMWFGPASRQYLPVDRLLAFDRCNRNELLDDGTVFIELYEDPLAFADPENRARQAAFREHMEFDRLRALSEELRALAPQDPVYEIYPRAGRRYHLVTWLDDSGAHVPRSQATHRWICLQEKDGTVIEQGLEHPPYRELGDQPS